MPAMPVSLESGPRGKFAATVLVDVAVVALWLMPPPRPLEQAVEKAQHSAASPTIFELCDLRILLPDPNGDLASLNRNLDQ